MMERLSKTQRRFLALLLLLIAVAVVIRAVAVPVVALVCCDGGPARTTPFTSATMRTRNVYSVSGCSRCGTATGWLKLTRAAFASGESKLRSPQSGLGNHSMS